MTCDASQRLRYLSRPRLTAVARRLAAVAVGIVLLAVAGPASGQTARPVPDAARQSRPPQADVPSQAEVRSLASDLTMQLRLIYRANLPEYSRRIDQMRDAIAAWHNSSQSAADRQQMTAWLRQAIRASMPGSTSPLPPLPAFAAVRQTAEPAPQSVLKPAQDVRMGSSAPTAARQHPVTAPATPQPKPVQSAKPITRPADTQRGDSPNFWERHPAAGQLPAELYEGDPFLDDPLPAESAATAE